PRIAHMLLSSSPHSPVRKERGVNEGHGEVGLGTDLAALLEERDPLAKESVTDVSLRVEVLRKWRSGERVSAERNVLERIERLASQWRKIFGLQVDNSTVIDTSVGKLLAEAYPERIARQMAKHSTRYKL